jgi:hypothetical protein
LRDGLYRENNNQLQIKIWICPDLIRHAPGVQPAKGPLGDTNIYFCYSAKCLGTTDDLDNEKKTNNYSQLSLLSIALHADWALSNSDFSLSTATIAFCVLVMCGGTL